MTVLELADKPKDTFTVEGRTHGHVFPVLTDPGVATPSRADVRGHLDPLRPRACPQASARAVGVATLPAPRLHRVSGRRVRVRETLRHTVGRRQARQVRVVATCTGHSISLVAVERLDIRPPSGKALGRTAGTVAAPPDRVRRDRAQGERLAFPSSRFARAGLLVAALAVLTLGHLAGRRPRVITFRAAIHRNGRVTGNGGEQKNDGREAAHAFSVVTPPGATRAQLFRGNA